MPSRMDYKDLSKRELITVIGIAESEVNKWLNAGCPWHDRDNARSPKGYCMPDVIKWLINGGADSLRKKPAKNQKKDPEDQDDMMQSGEGFDDNLDRYRSKKADLAELELEQKRGKLIERDLHDEIIMEAGDYVRSSFQTLPRSVATTLAKTHSPAEVETHLEQRIAGILESIAREPK